MSIEANSNNSTIENLPLEIQKKIEQLPPVTIPDDVLGIYSELFNKVETLVGQQFDQEALDKMDSFKFQYNKQLQGTGWAITDIKYDESTSTIDITLLSPPTPLFDGKLVVNNDCVTSA